MSKSYRQLSSWLHISILTGRIPDGPDGPGGPAGPVLPVTPIAPTSPRGPGLPKLTKQYFMTRIKKSLT